MTIEVRGLTKVFETGRRRHRTRVDAVRNISLDIAPGELVDVRIEDATSTTLRGVQAVPVAA